MAVDGLSSDQLFIEQQSETMTDMILEVQERTVTEVYSLKGDRTAEEFLLFISGLSILEIVRAKASNIISMFEQSHGTMLQTIQGFASIPEGTLQALVDFNKNSLISQLDNMSGIIRKEIINGVVGGIPPHEILKAVRGQGALSAGQLKTLIDTSMNDYSRTVTKLMMDTMPKNHKYEYVGPLDGKTRPACVEMIAAGRLTKDQIISNFSKFGNILTTGGGYNCRHKWDHIVEGFGSDPEEAKQRLKDLD